MSDRLTCDEVRELAAGFVLGALEPDEMAAVREHLASCEDAHEEVLELGGVVPYLAETVDPVEPPAVLRSRLLALAASDLERGVVVPTLPAVHTASNVTPTAPAVPTAPPVRPTAPDVIPITRGRGQRTAAWLVAIAAAVAIVALAGWNLVLQSDLGSARTYQQTVADALVLAAQPGSRIAVLAPAQGTASGATGLAVIPASGAGRIVMRGLAATSGSQVYEAWTIAQGGTPTPVGGFTVGSNGIGVFDGLTAEAGGVTIALTLEPRPNPTSPTPPIVSSGVATAPAS